MIIDVQGKSSVFIGDFPLPCRNHGTFPFWNQCCAIFPNVFEAQNLLSSLLLSKFATENLT